VPTIKERRKDLRVAVDWSAVLLKGDRVREATLTNISATGALLLSDEPLRPKESYKVYIIAPEHRPMKLNFEVAWLGVDCSQDNVSSCGMGIRFTRVSSNDRQFLCDFVAQQYEGKIGHK
jgi:hypothetical protein